MTDFWQNFIAVWTAGVFLFIFVNRQRWAAYFDNRIEDKQARHNLAIIQDSVMQERSNLEVLRETVELERQRARIPFDVEIDAAKKKLEAEAERIALLDKEIELERTRLALPHQVEIDAAKAIADQHEREANIEVNKAERLAKVMMDKLEQSAAINNKKELERELANLPEYQEAAVQALKISNQEREAEIRAKKMKIEANEKYVHEFLRQEDYNGKYDDDYTVRTPKPPYVI
jgi:hypothetical protein